MGSRRRVPRAAERSLTPQIRIGAVADAFAGQLADLLNHTVTDGIRLTAVTDQQEQQAAIAYGISRRDAGSLKMIPLAIRGNAHLYLGLSFHMTPDDSGRYPMIRSSVMFLSPDADYESARVLLHYDYERDKADDYPDAHLQVVATSEEWEEVALRYGTEPRPLERLHLPVGGRRYRPTVEDLIEFLIVEKLVTPRRGWKRWVEDGRADFEERQLRAAVRRNPEAAIAILREEGHIS